MTKDFLNWQHSQRLKIFKCETTSPIWSDMSSDAIVFMTFTETKISN